MSGLSSLNAFNRFKVIEYIDLRASGPIFDTPFPVEVRQTIEYIDAIDKDGMLLRPSINILEISNFAIADVKYTLKVKTFGSPLITGTDFEFDPFQLPPELDFTQTAGEIQFTGFRTAEDWEFFKNNIYWSVPSNYSTFPTWWLEATISWYNDDIEEEQSVSWDFYDPAYYKAAFIDAETSLQAKGTGTFLFKSTANALAEMDPGPIFRTRRSSMTLSAQGGLIFIEPVILVEYEAVLSGAFNAEMTANLSPAQAIITQDIIASVDAYTNYIVSWKKFLRIDAYLLPTLTRVKGGADSNQMSSEFSMLVDTFQIELEAQGSMSIEATKFKGIVNENFVAETASSTVAVKTARTPTVMNSAGAMTTQSANSRIRFTQASIQAIGSLSATAQITEAIVMILDFTDQSVSRTFNLGLTPAGSGVTVNWGDGSSIETVTTNGTVNHTYAPGNKYTLTIDRVSSTGTALTRFTTASTSAGGAVEECRTFGKLGLTSFTFSSNFSQTKLTKVPGYIPTTITTLYQAFRACSNLNDPKISLWNTANITNLEGCFQACVNFNQSLNNWNTANVTNMADTFQACADFNQPLNNWNTGNVTNMYSMFGSARSFNQSLNNWNTSKVTRMDSMFAAARSFNQPLNNWDTSKVTNMSQMFDLAEVFDQDISGWCVSLIPTKPSSFDAGTPTSWTTAEKPVWGTCP